MSRSCTILGCGRPHHASGLCSTHDARRRRGRPIDAPMRVVSIGPAVCLVPGCGRASRSNRNGLCNTHSERVRLGRPLDPPVRLLMNGAPVIDRVMARIKSTEAGCWVYTGGLTGGGYGHVSTGGGRKARAHRVSYEHYVGPIPDGLQLDHLCRNRACVNPAHLEPVTCSENVRRGYASRRAEAAA